MNIRDTDHNIFAFKDFEAWNEEMVKKYNIEDYYAKSNPLIKAVERKRIRWILKFLEAQAGDKILEVGCGGGHVLENVPVDKVYGIDLSERMLAIASKRLRTKAELKKCNAEEIIYPDGFFDKIICTEVLEHTPRPERVVKEIARILKSEGQLIVTIPNEEMINRCKNAIIKTRLFKLLFKNVPEQNDWHLHSFSLRALRSLMEGIFEEISLKAIPNGIFPLRYVAKYKVLK